MLSPTSRNFLCRARWSVQQFGWSRHTQPDHFRRELRTARRCQKRSVRPTRSSAAVSGQPHRTVATVRQGAHAALSEPDRGEHCATEPVTVCDSRGSSVFRIAEAKTRSWTCRESSVRVDVNRSRSVVSVLTLCADAASGGVSAVVGRVGGGGWRTNVSTE